MTDAAGYWFLHGTRKPWSDSVMRAGLTRHSQAAFVLPAGQPVDQPRLFRTVAVALSHAIGLAGWAEAYAGRRRGEAVWCAPALVMLGQPAGWRPPPSMSIYHVQPHQGAGSAGPTHRYLRVRDVGALDDPDQRRLVVDAGWVDLALLVGEIGEAVPTRWFNRAGASPSNGASSRNVCEHLAVGLVAQVGVLMAERSDDASGQDGGSGGHRRLRQLVGQGTAGA